MSFNPRTPAGCDGPVSGRPSGRLGFNPRTPAGCDLPEGYTPQRLYDVSTHAPLRGATCEGVLFCWNHGSFNPRTPAGCDGISMALTLFSKVSTHAPLRGATLTIVQPLTPKQFQPTHPCGVRPGACGLGSVIADVSTHAPLRGATSWIPINLRLGLGFNPRTPAGCD